MRLVSSVVDGITRTVPRSVAGTFAGVDHRCAHWWSDALSGTRSERGRTAPRGGVPRGPRCRRETGIESGTLPPGRGPIPAFHSATYSRQSLQADTEMGVRVSRGDVSVGTADHHW